MATKNKVTWVDVLVVLLVITFFIFIIYYVLITINKSKEKDELVKHYNNLNTRKSLIERLKQNLDYYFRISYNLVKILFCLAFVLVCILIYKKMPGSGFWDFISVFTDVFGALSLIVLFLFLVFEENPLNVFYLRKRLKNVLRDLIYGENKTIIEELPEIEKEMKETKYKIDSY